MGALVATIDKKRGTPKGTMDVLAFMTSLAQDRAETWSEYLFTIRHYRPEGGKMLVYRLEVIGR